MVSSLGYTLLHLFAVRPTPHLHATSTPWRATLHPPPFSLWRSGGLAGLACIGAPRAFSIPRKLRPTDTNSEAGMIRAGSTRVALRQTTVPGPDRLRCRALARSLVSIPPKTSFEPDGPASSASWSREATYGWYYTRFTCCPSLCCALWELIVSPSCAGNTSTSDCHEALSSFTRNALFRQLSGTTYVRHSLL